MKTWKKRFFLLSSTTLSYYETPPSANVSLFVLWHVGTVQTRSRGEKGERERRGRREERGGRERGGERGDRGGEMRRKEER